VCSKLLKQFPFAGLPPTSITTDSRLLYWSNETEGKVYSVMKPMLTSMSRGIASVNMTGVRRIAALGQHLQPYPGIRHSI